MSIASVITFVGRVIIVAWRWFWWVIFPVFTTLFQIHGVWTFAEDWITREVHSTARIDVGAFSGDCFHTDYFAEEGRRFSIYGRKSINGIVKWLGIPRPSCDYGPPWIGNLLCTSPHWVDGVRVGAWAWGVQLGIRFGRVGVLWRGAVPGRNGQRSVDRIYAIETVCFDSLT